MGVGAFAACDAPAPSEEQVRADVAAETDAARRLILLETHAKRNPDSANAHLWLARAYRERGGADLTGGAENARAAAEYERAAALDPKDAISRVERGYLFIERDLRTGRVPDATALASAERWVRGAWALDPSCERRHDLIGLFDLELDAMLSASSVHLADDAATILREGIQRCTQDPRWVPAWSAALGRVELSAGHSDEAQRWACAAVAAGHGPAIAACTEAGGEIACSAVRSGDAKLPASSTMKAKFSEAMARCDSSDASGRGTVRP